MSCYGNSASIMSVKDPKHRANTLVLHKQVQCDLCLGKQLIKRNVGVAAFWIA